MLSVRILTPIASLALLIYISRKLGATELGKYSTLLAIFQMVQLLPLLGLNTYIVREVSKNKELALKLIPNASAIGLASATFIGIVIYLLSVGFEYPPDMLEAAPILGMAVISSTIALIYESVFIAYEKMVLIGYVTIAENVMKLVVSVCFVAAGFGVVSLITVMTFSRFLAGICYFFAMKRINSGIRPIAFDVSFCKELLKVCPVFLGLNVFSMLISRADFVLLSKMRTFDEVGYYTAAYKVFEVSTMVSSTYFLAIFPVMTRYFNESTERFANLVETSLKFIVIIMILMVALVFMYSDLIITLIYSEKFLASIAALKILSATALFVSLDQVFTGMLLAGNRQNIDLKVIMISSICYLAFLFLLIPYFGLYGASWATLAAMFVQMTLRFFYARKYILKVNIWGTIGKIMIVGLAMAFLIVLMKNVTWLIVIPLAIVFYISMLILLRVISKDELAWVYSLRVK